MELFLQEESLISVTLSKTQTQHAQGQQEDEVCGQLGVSQGLSPSRDGFDKCGAYSVLRACTLHNKSSRCSHLPRFTQSHGLHPGSWLPGWTSVVWD